MKSRGRILIVDDEVNARTALAEILRDEGYSVETAADGFKALPKLDDFDPEILLTDLKMPGMDGIELMRRSREREPERPVIVMTAFGAIDTAVAAMREGAADYITKPINIEQLGIILERALERRRLRAEAGQLRARLADRHRLSNIVGSSAPMQEVFEIVHQVAPSRASVLITGESGTGKELIAAAIHEHSPRASGPFVKLHCAALAESLLESELFGHERGAFTGALARRDGRFSQADGGTLFLDEIGDLSPAIQVKLLRFLQEREFERVGGNETLSVDVRVVAATNRNLEARLREGLFREDLYYRLNVVSIPMPPLRARASDITLLANFFLQRYAAENQRSIAGFSEAALERLTSYGWPGNVRELENVIERAVVVSRSDEIRAEHLGPAIGPAASPGTTGGMSGGAGGGPGGGPGGGTSGGAIGAERPPIPGSTLAEVERYAILKTLEYTGGSTSRAAELLHISPRKVQYKLREYHLGALEKEQGKPR